MLNAYIKPLEKEREFYRKIFSLGESISVVGLVFQPGTYFWLLIFTSLTYMRAKKQLWKCLVPLYITFLVCLVSPVNGAVRYILPLIEALPILLILCKNNGIKVQLKDVKQEIEETSNG